ncbi:MAG: M20/M25/M40 family metallo-hydrolase [Thermoanaerobaculia bacterium]|nr:M20/M25/M40 family metallo-hydrolase [Thermoanaerobaculia bacterium]
MTPEEKKRRHRNERIAATILVLALAGSTIWMTRHRKALDEQVRRDRMYIPKNIEFSPELEMLQQYLKFDTSNPPGNELPAARWLASQLEKAGVRAEIIESAPRRANVYARLKGKRSGEGLLLLHHIDVVPATNEGWKRPPFAAEIHFNELYGRGALDMKATGICFLRAFLDVARSGRPPENDIIFLAVADEEAGSDLGMKWLVEHRPDILSGVRFALNEGGITEMTSEKMTYFGIEIGTKQTVSLTLEGSTRSNLQRARIALEPWFISRSPSRIVPEVKAWMRDLAPQRIAYREHLEDVDRAVARGKFWSLPIGYREMTQSGLWAEAITPKGAGFEMRTLLLNLPDEDPDRRIEWLSRRVAPYGVRIGRILRKEGPMPLSSTNTLFYKRLVAEASRTYSAPAGSEILNRWQNDSRFLRKRGIDSYGINPFPVDYFQSETIHAANERIRTDYFNRGVGFTVRIVTGYASSE